MTRQEANRGLVKILGELVEKHPDTRFSQMLRNYMFVKETRPVAPETGFDWKNEFYLESEALLERVYRCRYGQEVEEDGAS